jgi:hypothetical protein
MQWTPGSPHVFYAPKSSHDKLTELFPPLEKIDALEFLARLITQIPEPRRHLLFYYGHYANVVRGRRQSLRTASLAIALQTKPKSWSRPKAPLQSRLCVGDGQT